MVAPGTVLQHRYEVLRPLGRGASSSALLARDLLRRDLVTLKLLHSTDPVLTSALRREFAALVGRFHPHLPLVRDLEAQPDHLFYTADFVDGVTLTHWARTRPERDVLAPLAHVLDALHFLHRIGIRHGDVKPDNILVTPEGQGVLIDLGCARPLGLSLDVVSGTPPFMAPEVLRGENTDARADLFAFGVTCSTVLKDPSPAQSTLLRRLTAERPDDRPSDASEVNEAFGFAPFTAGPPRGRLDHIVGREAPLQAFRDALRGLQQRRPHARCLAVHGPDGVGRSRLLQEMKWEAQRFGAVVEGDSRAPDAVDGLLARALGHTPLRVPGVAGILEARRELALRPEPVVVVLDDTHLLAPDQRDLLDAWLRLLEPTDPWLLLLTGRDEPSFRSHAILPYRLDPLDERSLADWTSGLLGPKAVPHVLRLTGGYPADVEVLFDKVLRGEIPESDLPHASVQASPGDLLLSLPKEAKHALSWIAVAPCDDATLRSCCDASSGVIVDLQQRGWIVRDGRSWRLQRGWLAPHVLGLLDEAVVAGIHRWHAEQERTSTPDRAYHYAKAGEWDRAGRLVLEHEVEIEVTPRAWRRVADALRGRVLAPEVQVGCARIDRLCGRSDQALSWLARALRSRPSPALRVTCRAEAALCHLAAGKLGRAGKAVRKGLQEVVGPEVRAALLDVSCRIGVQLGDYEQVVSDGVQGLALATLPCTRAKLHESLGIAYTYLGQAEQAADHLRKAEADHSDAIAPRERVRLLSFSAILAYRQGDLPRAIDGYQQALQWAEQHGLADHMAAAAMNLGTAQQQAGEWGQALASYERGLQIARAIGKDNTARTLRLNLANLYAGVGAFDRARALVATLRESRDLGYVQANVEALEAELLEAEGHREDAARGFERAEVLFAQQGALREVSEMRCHRASVLLTQNHREQAQALTRDAPRDSAGPPPLPSDLLARWHAVRARSLLPNRPIDALPEAQQAVACATASKQPALEAEMRTLIADVYHLQGASQLARDHRLHALRSWETIAVGLPEPLRPAFWSHPVRNALPRSQRPDPVPAPRQPRNLVRVLEINRRLNSSLAVDDVLSCALDAAIELSEAERGFLLVRPEAGGKRLEVAVARNLDRERIGRSHLKFSRSIAENVVRTGQPVSTTDALADERFRANQSVHAMRLRSVVCVPVTAPEGVLGAIYLDHRFRKDQFDDDVVQVLLAFADQVAIALRNARLVSDLERRTHALQKEQERVQELLEGQAAEIDRLSSEVRTRQEALEFRYDYSSIVGASAPMQAVFRVLDRVTDTNIDVLVQGESGTGKELVARALHFNGPRRQGPFLSINCAALPENLLESELFGVTRGAFTGADRDREGLLASACGGTLFLDEIGEMPLAMQAKLLRVLQERRVRPLGSNREVPVDIRLVSATNRRLLDDVSAGRFREDLYYRVAVVEIRLPPLRERPDDIPALCTHILERAAASMGGKVVGVRADALRALMHHPLPGNVRQLDNLLRRALVLSEGQAIGLQDLDLAPASRSDSRKMPRDRAAFEQEESARILACLEQHRWNVCAVARAIGMPRNTLYRKLRKYRLQKP
jgi:transcriptional regulator with GAF, ATPase, and Fis domain/serine/threonine protein kinase